MFSAARVHRSTALDADARHLVTDVWTSAGVVIGIGLVTITGWLWLDAVVAIGVALNILREGWHLIWSASQGLMDEAVEPEVLAQIQEVLHDFRTAVTRPIHKPISFVSTMWLRAKQGSAALSICTCTCLPNGR
jgi:divalent metal cation (Fe/Co/Zn/Cd) transporter